MARNGSGVYSLPAGNPVTTGTTISSTWANNTLSDIATALTASLAKDGQTSPTANLPMGSFVLTGLGAGAANGQSLRYEQLFSQGAPTDIASAATTDIGAVRSNFLTVTGTTGITSLGTNYNGPKMLRFTGALTLTHNATTLILPGAANFTTVAGDTCIAIPKSTASGTADGWNLVQFTRASGVPSGAVAAGAITSSGLTQATARILGRTTASTGAIEELTAGAALSLTAGSLNVADAGITPAKLSGAQSGSAPALALRAWCVFNGGTAGTNAPTAGANVTSVQRVSAGTYTVNFTTALPDANFAASVMFSIATSANQLANITGQTSSSFSFEVKQPGVGNYDVNSVFVMVTR